MAEAHDPPNNSDEPGSGNTPDDIPPENNNDLPNEEIEQLSSWALLIHIVLLIITIWITYFFQKRHIRFMHETLLSMILGAFVGLALRLISGTGRLQAMIEFKHTYFFNVLLPPIILNSGYDLHEKSFFRNFGRIMTFAMLGTFTSVIIIGILEYILGLIGLGGPFTFMDSLVFGSILSSTDPVTVLAIFHQVRVDPNLYAVIFGESALNDAVAIVLFGTLNKVENGDLTFTSFFRFISIFLAVFSGSLVVGVTIGLVCALVLKHTSISEFPSLETCMVSLLAYGSYLFANAIELSGIVSLLFCGITMKHYAYPSMSWQSRHTTRHMFKVLATLAENFIFIYLAVTIFTNRDGFHPILITTTTIVILIARYGAVYPYAYALNRLARYRLRKEHPVIGVSEPSSSTNSPITVFTDDMMPVRNMLPQRAGFLLPQAISSMNADTSQIMPASHQFMLWWAGLRGAVSFALSLEVRSETARPYIQSTTLIVVLLTVFVLGGGTVKMVDLLGLDIEKQKNSGNARSADVDEDGYHEEEFPWLTNSQKVLSFNLRKGSRRFQEAARGTDGDSDDRTGFADSNQTQTSKHWFTSFDDQYLKPIFIKANPFSDAGRTPTQAENPELLRSSRAPDQAQNNPGTRFLSLAMSSNPPPRSP